MATVLESLRKSSINIQSISQTLSDTKKSTSTVNNSVENISRIVATNTRVKRELFTRSNILNSRREEASKRQELEDQIESTRVSSSPQLGLSFSSRSEKGPLGRILGFLGFTFAGWIVENLPTWIFMGQEFISRINSFGRSMYNMVYNMQNIIKYFGDTLKYSFDAVLRLDFDEFAGEGTVARSFEELNLAVQDLGTNITDTFKLFTTPLTESLETGEKAPGLGETRPDTMFPPIPQEGEGPQVTGITKQALDIISKYESAGAGYNAMNQGTIPDSKGQRPKATIGGKTSKDIVGKNLTDMTIGEVIARQNRRLTNDQGFIHAAGRYQIIGNTLPGAMKGAGLKPTDMFSPENQDKMGIYLLKTGGIGKWEGLKKATSQEIAIIKQAQRTPVTFTPPTPQAPASPPPSSSVQITPAPMLTTSGFGWRWGRQHLGIDIVPKTGKVDGAPVIIRKGGTVEYANIGSGNMGQILITHDDGTQSRYLHVNNFRVRAGQKVSAGQTIASLAAMGAPGIGNATGPHLHFEYYPSRSSGPVDPAGVYQNYVALGGKVMGTPPKPLDPNQQPRSSKQAQISAQPKPQQPAEMTPERKGSQILFIDDTQPQQPQVSYPVQQQPSVTPTISEFKLLNNFIKNKLLLDLAYL
jgi:murein DD-endopeptidase MepM/ murein hydrolase activator NlpD